MMRATGGGMTVQNYGIPPDIIELVEVRMLSGEPFTAAELQYYVTPTLEAAGFPGWIADRLADRLIQKHRKAGRIKFTWEPHRPAPVWRQA